MVSMKRRNFKNLIISACLLVLLSAASAFAASSANLPLDEQISKIENSVLGLNYSKESDSDRLKRIEDEVFGSSYNSSKLSLQDRIDKLNSALGLETLAEAKAPVSELYKDEAEGVNYPVVDMFEMQLFGKNFKDENIYKRLERLEEKTFGAAKKGDLAQRTDALKAKISMMKPSSTLPNYQTGEYFRKVDPKDYQNNYAYGDMPENLAPGEEDVIAKARQDALNRADQSGRQSYDYNYGYGGSDASLQIAGLENSLFGQTYSYDPMTVRLNRLERRIFQRDFATDDDYSRIERLQAAANAKKTAKYYDGNKFQKFAATGMQLGTFVLMILALLL